MEPNEWQAVAGGFRLRLEMSDESRTWAQQMAVTHHYLGKRVHALASVEAYRVWWEERPEPIGFLTFGRTQAPRCGQWYGNMARWERGEVEVTNWQVLNLARMWLHPDLQRGGCCYGPESLPGYLDRKGIWRSTLATTILRAAFKRVGYEYLTRRPPLHFDQPWRILWMLSYCDKRRHKGIIYDQAGFTLYRDEPRNPIRTWRLLLPALTGEQDTHLQHLSQHHPRTRRKRRELERRAAHQMTLSEV